MKELAEYDEVRKIVRQGKGTVALSGCVDSQKLHMIYGLSDGLKYKVIVTYNDLKAKEIYEEYRFYDRNVMLYPAKDLIFFQADIHGNQLVQERIKTLRRVVEGKPVTIVTTYAALMTPQVLWEEKDIIHTERGGLFVYAAVDLDIAAGAVLLYERADAADLGQHVRHEALAAEAGLHRHHEHHVELVEIRQYDGGRRPGLYRKGRQLALGSYLVERREYILRLVGLDVEADEVRARVAEPADVAVRPVYHEVHVQKHVRRLA